MKKSEKKPEFRTRRYKKTSWYAEHARRYRKVVKDKREVKVVLLGDSIQDNLSRYPIVWDPLKNLYGCHNLGIGGDRTQNVLWRVEHMFLPATTAAGIIAVGVNDINDTAGKAFDAQLIANSVIKCADRLRERCPSISIAVLAILPAVETDWGRQSRIAEVNFLVEKACGMRDYLFVAQDDRWIDPSTGSIDRSLFFDGLHMSRKGNIMLGKIYQDVLKNIFTYHRTTIRNRAHKPPREKIKIEQEEETCSYTHVCPTNFTTIPNAQHPCHGHKKQRRKKKKRIKSNPISSSHVKCRVHVNNVRENDVSGRDGIKIDSMCNCKLNFFGFFLFLMSFFVLTCSVSIIHREETVVCFRKFSLVLFFLSVQFIDILTVVYTMLFILVMMFLLLYMCLGLRKLALALSASSKKVLLFFQKIQRKLIEFVLKRICGAMRGGELLMNVHLMRCSTLYMVIKILSIIGSVFYINYLNFIICHNFIDWNKVEYNNFSQPSMNHNFVFDSLYFMRFFLIFILMLLRFLSRIFSRSQERSNSHFINTYPFYIRKKLKRHRRNLVCVPSLIVAVLYLSAHTGFSHKQVNLRKCYDKYMNYQLIKVTVSINALWLNSLNQQKVLIYETSRYHWIFLLRSGDVELNPGPVNWYSLCDLAMCPFFRTAVFHLFSKKKLIPDDQGDEQPNLNQGFIDLQAFFQNNFNAHLIEFPKLMENKDRFDELNHRWDRNNKESKDMYYHTFSPMQWSKLRDSDKKNHSVNCVECPRIHSKLMSIFEQAMIYEVEPMNKDNDTCVSLSFDKKFGTSEESDSVNLAKKGKKRKGRQYIGRIYKKRKSCVTSPSPTAQPITITFIHDLDTTIIQPQLSSHEKRKLRKQNYGNTEKGKIVHRKAQSKYSISEKGKTAHRKAKKKYDSSENGKIGHRKAQSKYSISEKGKTAHRKAKKKYDSSENGKIGHRNDQKKYAKSKRAILTRNIYVEARKTNKSYHHTLARSIQNKYMRQYRNKLRMKRREGGDLFIDFNNAPTFQHTSTTTLRDHRVSSDILQNYKQKQKLILRSRKSLNDPFSRGWTRKPVKFKNIAAKVLQTAIQDANLSINSLVTLGLSRKTFFYSDGLDIAAKKLANQIHLKRLQCVQNIKYCANKLKSKIEAIVAAITIQGPDYPSSALLGMQCHSKGSEPFFPSVSFRNGQQYNYKENQSKEKTNDSIYHCTDNCVLLTSEEEEQFGRFLRSITDLKANQLRTFISNYFTCTKLKDYSHKVAADLDPQRLYLFPVHQRNHPELCYHQITADNPNDGCLSTEVLMRKAIVHYTNPRSVHNIMMEAVKAHKLLADLDAATALGDLEYLSKLLKIRLQCQSTIGKSGTSVARHWTNESIEETLSSDLPKCDMKGKIRTYLQRFNMQRKDIPKAKCCSCNILEKPSSSHKIDIHKWKQLKFDPENDTYPNNNYLNLTDFLLDKDIIKPSSQSQSQNDNTDHSADEHPCLPIHGLHLCNYCYTALNKDQIPSRSLLNNMFTGECPDFIRQLNPIEMMLVRKVKCFQTIIKAGPISGKLPYGDKMNAVKGRFIHLPLTTEKTFNRLKGTQNEHLWDVGDLVYVYGKPKKDNSVWRHLIDRHKVYDALKWLVENNSNYEGIELPEKPEDILTNEFGECNKDIKPDFLCNFCQETFSSHEELSKHEKECALMYYSGSDDEIDERPVRNANKEIITHDRDDRNLQQSNFENLDNQLEPEFLCNFCQETFSSNEELERHEKECALSGNEGIAEQDHLPEDLQQNNLENPNDEKQREPWIERINRDDLADEFGHLTLRGITSDIETADEFFKMLNINDSPVPTHAPNLDCEAFPERFPFGIGGLGVERIQKINDAFFHKAHVLTSDAYARRNQQYIFYMAQQKEIRDLKAGIFQVLNSKDNLHFTKGDMTRAAQARDPALLKKVQSAMRNIPTQKPFWTSWSAKSGPMEAEYGPPTWFHSLSPAEYDDEELFEYLKHLNSDLFNDDLKDRSTMNLVTMDPVSACNYLQGKFDAIFQYILSDAQPLGKVTHYISRVEYQTRLMPHYHSIYWIEDAPIMGKSSDEEVLDFITNYACCQLPSVHDDPFMYNLVYRYQFHKCNAYCLRKSKNRRPCCKFSFPRPVCKRPVLHNVVSSIASHNSKTYQRRLYELERRKCEERINDYNPVLMWMWKGNMDLQYIGEESGTLFDYIFKYVSKAPKSAIDDFHVENMCDRSNFGTLLSMSMRLMQNREMGAMEATNYLLSRPPVKTNCVFQYVDTRFPHKRKKMLKSNKKLQTLPDNSTDIFYGNLVGNWYPSRPAEHENYSLYEFTRMYKRATATDVRSTSNEVQRRLIQLQNGEGHMIKRVLTPTYPYPPIVYGPTYLDPVADKEEFYYSHLMLHIPWRDEQSLIGDSLTYEIEYLLLKDDFPKLRSSVEKVLAKRSMQKNMKEKVAKASAQLQQRKDEEEMHDGEDGSDLLEDVRKNSIIQTEEHLQQAIDSLSEDQRRVYQLFVTNVEHFYEHQQTPPLCTCSNFQPIRLFVSGFGGSGKSYLIRTIMGFSYVLTELRKKPSHVLLGAPTGIAACNVGGQTLHSLWNLPVEHGHKAQYSQLSTGVRNKKRANFSKVCAHIIDEISMVSNKMLMYLNLRMMEVFGSTDLFGSMPLIAFGDLLQLDPANGAPPFVTLTPGQIHLFTTGLPCAPELWKSFAFEQLSTNHRQRGDSNTRWRDFLSRARCGTLTAEDVQYVTQRLIDVSRSDKEEMHLDAFVKAFLQCEKDGFNPVCLLPKREMCTKYNKAIMDAKGENPVYIKANDRFFCPKNMLQASKQKFEVMDTDDRQTAGLENLLAVAIGTRVMLRTNEKGRPGLVNGARGVLQDIIMKEDGTVLKLMVDFDGIDGIQCIERKERRIKVMRNCYVYRSMFPIINSYAMTIHKSQSLSLPCVFADLGDEIFCSGMGYVALSRCETYEGLHLMNFNPRKIKASRNACIEYARLHGNKFDFNNGCWDENQERTWCTTSVKKKAVKCMAADIQQEKKKGRPRKKKNKHNTPEKINDPSTSKKKNKKPPTSTPVAKRTRRLRAPRLVTINIGVHESINEILNLALNEENAATTYLMDTITPDIMSDLFRDVIIPYGDRSSDNCMNRLAIELHPDPFGYADGTNQKWLSSDLINIYGMFLRDLSETVGGPSVYHFAPYARFAYRQDRTTYVQSYITHTHTERQYSIHMDGHYQHSVEAGIDFAGDPFDKDVIVMVCNDNNNHWYLLILDKRPHIMRVFMYDSLRGSSLDERCNFFINFINEYRTYVIRRYRVNWLAAEPLRNRDFQFEDCRSNQQENGFDCGVYALINAEAFLRRISHRTFTQGNIPLLRLYIMHNIMQFAHTTHFPLLGQRTIGDVVVDAQLDEA